MEQSLEDNDWVLAKPKPQPSGSSGSVPDDERQKCEIRAARFGSGTGPSTAANVRTVPVVLPSAPSSSSPSAAPSVVPSASVAAPWEAEFPLPVREGKRKAEENMEKDRKEEKVKERSRLEQELTESRLRKQIYRAQEKEFKEMAEKAEERQRQIELQLEKLDL